MPKEISKRFKLSLSSVESCKMHSELCSDSGESFKAAPQFRREFQTQVKICHSSFMLNDSPLKLSTDFTVVDCPLRLGDPTLNTPLFEINEQTPGILNWWPWNRKEVDLDILPPGVGPPRHFLRFSIRYSFAATSNVQRRRYCPCYEPRFGENATVTL